MEWLKTILGDAYTDDIGKQISTQIGKDFVSRADFNAANEEKKGLTAQLQDRDKQLDELKKVDADGLQQKIKELQADNQKQADAHQTQLQEIKFNSALDLALQKSGAKNPDALRGLLKLDQISMGDDGLKGFDEQLTTIKESNDFLFANDPSATALAMGGGNVTDPFLAAAMSGAGVKIDNN